MQFILDLAARVRAAGGAAERGWRRRRVRTRGRVPSRRRSDPPKTRAQRRAEARAKAKELMRREGEQRKAGGQPGHRGAGRELRPEDQIDEIVDHYPDACGGCGREFTAEQRRPRRRFGRHQVAELPPISVIWTEHRTHQLRCRHCRARTSARLPDGIGGSRVRAEVAGGDRDVDRPAPCLAARDQRSSRVICSASRSRPAAADAICQRASDALAGPHLQLQDWVLDQGAVHVDETGWRTRGEGRALWTATTPDAVFFADRRALQPRAVQRADRHQLPRDRDLRPLERLQPSRPQPAPGVLVAPPARLPPPRRRAGRAEDLRRARRPAHRPGVRRLARLPARAPRPRSDSRPRSRRSRPSSRSCSRHASPKKARNRWHRQFANNLLKVWPALWTFTTIDGVEPTNNPAERALRAPVIHRKVSLGTQSETGERFAERALSAAGTCRLQHRSLFTYLSELIAAHNRGDPFPALA